MKTLLLTTAIILATQTPTARWWDVEVTNDIDPLCRSFMEWQAWMKAHNQPPEKYEKTGMEKHCPAMT